MARKNYVNEVPQYGCKSCTHCQGGQCQVFERPVNLNTNKCWYHSQYVPQAGVFRPNPNLEIIIKAEEKERKKAYKGYLREEEMMRKAILKEIEKEKQNKGVA